MTDLDAALLGAWMKLKPKLDADRDELNRRLARRRTPSLLRPPREWCIAVRASDRRITPMSAPIEPQGAMYLPNYDSTRFVQAHTVTLTRPLLTKLCQPLHLTPPHEDVLDIARMLGVHRDQLNRARKKGLFSVEYYKGLFGRFGKPVRMLFTRRLLDPCSGKFWRCPHPLWGTLWQYLPQLVPDDFEQTITRVPFYVGTAPAVRAARRTRSCFAAGGGSAPRAASTCARFFIR